MSAENIVDFTLYKNQQEADSNQKSECSEELGTAIQELILRLRTMRDQKD